MTSKEIINEYIKNYRHNLTCMHNPKIMKRQVELINEMELIKKDLEILEILKQYLFVRVEDKPIFDGSYLVVLQDDEDLYCDYIHIFVSKEEKEKIKEWLKEEEK